MKVWECSCCDAKTKSNGLPAGWKRFGKDPMCPDCQSEHQQMKSELEQEREAMIRFIDMGKQIYGISTQEESEVMDPDSDMPRNFAFWNTVTNRFLEFGREQAWNNWQEFEDSLRDEYGELHWKNTPTDRPYYERCKNLCPDWVFKGGPK